MSSGGSNEKSKEEKEDVEDRREGESQEAAVDDHPQHAR